MTTKDRTIAWLAHLEPYLLPLTLVGFIGSDLIPGWWSLALFLPNALLFAFTVGATSAHAHRFLCTRCAAQTPLDGLAEAARREPQLKAVHWLYDRARLIQRVVWVAVLGIYAVRFWWWQLGDVLLVLLYGYWGVVGWLTLRHRPVQPWCRRCHWRDGGDPEPEPWAPDPHGAEVDA